MLLQKLALRPTTSVVIQINGEDRESNDYVIDWITCKDRFGETHWIQNPSQVLKKRMRFKLLTLLEAGCDPNVLDNEGEPPSDYARRKNLWPQWTWALLNAGYIYDVVKDSWVRRV